jgi:hypothetical protein
MELTIASPSSQKRANGLRAPAGDTKGPESAVQQVVYIERASLTDRRHLILAAS